MAAALFVTFMSLSSKSSLYPELLASSSNRIEQLKPQSLDKQRLGQKRHWSHLLNLQLPSSLTQALLSLQTFT